MTLLKEDLSRNPVNLSDEFKKYEALRLKNTPLTTSGSYSVTSDSSGLIYSTTTGGEVDVLNQLQDKIRVSLIEASDWNQIFNSQAYPASRLSVNQKTADDGQDHTIYSVLNAVLSDDTTDKIFGKSSTSIAITGAQTATINANNYPIDFDTLEDGSISNDSDYIFLGIKVDDPTKLNLSGSYIAFYSDATPAGNLKRYIFDGEVFKVNDWTILKLLKSNFETLGSGSFSNINSYRLRFATTESVNIKYQFIQLVKKHPGLAEPSYFQENGEVVATVNSGEWVVVEEFGIYKIISLTDGATRNALEFADLFGDCIVNFVTELSGAGDDAGYYGWGIDSSNLLYVQVINNVLKFESIDDGVAETLGEFSFAISEGDVAIFKLTKNDIFLKLETSLNGIKFEPIVIEKSLSFTQGKILIGNRREPKILSVSITTISHADTCNRAERARGLDRQPYLEATRTTNQSIANGVNDPINFDTISEDSFGIIQKPTEEYEITESGLYEIDFGCAWTSDDTGRRLIIIEVNGTSKRIVSQNATVGSATHQEASKKIRLNKGDIIIIKVSQNRTGGTALDVVANDYSPLLVIAKVGE